MAAITGGAVAVIMAVVAAAMVMAPGKGSGDVTRGVSPCRKLGLAKCSATKASLEMI